jgi:hypothetical protein
MELGYDVVLLNTAVASARDSLAMARALRHAVIAGRLAFEAGRMGRFLYANASSPAPTSTVPNRFRLQLFKNIRVDKQIEVLPMPDNKTAVALARPDMP